MGTSTLSGPLRTGSQREGATPTLGSVVLMQTNTVAYTDTTAKVLFYVPANSKIIDVYVDVQTAFNSDGTDLLTVGTAADPDAFADDVDVSSAGRKLGSADTTARANQASGVGSADIAIQAVYTAGGSAASAGAARVTVLYIQT